MLGVFTAAITANVVFVGIAVGDGDFHSALRAALAIAGFAAGVLAGKRALRRGAPLALAGIALAQAAFLAGWVAADGRPTGVELDLLAIASALAMGGQTALAVSWRPDVTTTYVTGTLTVLIGELVDSRGTREDRVRQGSVIGGVALGAAAGALLLTEARQIAAVVPLAITLLVTAWLLLGPGRPTGAGTVPR